MSTDNTDLPVNLTLAKAGVDTTQYLMGGAYSEDKSIDLENFDDKEIKREIDRFSSAVDLRGPRVLIRSYITPEKTKGGLYLGQKTMEEQIYTCAVGLVVQKSKSSYDDPYFDRSGHWCRLGEWVAFDKTRAILQYIFGLPCWVVQEEGVIFGLTDPRITTKK